MSISYLTLPRGAKGARSAGRFRHEWSFAKQTFPIWIILLIISLQLYSLISMFTKKRSKPAVMDTSSLISPSDESRHQTTCPTELARSLSLIPTFIVVAVDATGMGIILPLLPFYSQRLGAPPFAIGALVSARSKTLRAISGLCHLGPKRGKRCRSVWSSRRRTLAQPAIHL